MDLEGRWALKVSELAAVSEAPDAQAVSMELKALLMARIEAAPTAHRCAVFNSFNGLCASLKQQDLARGELLKCIAPDLYRLTTKVLPKGDADAARQLPALLRLLQAWATAKTFSRSTISNCVRYVEGCKPTRPQVAVRPGVHTYHAAPTASGTYVFNNPSQSTLESDIIDASVEEEMRVRDLVEKERSIQKKQKLEDALRPEGEDAQGEFLEWWAATVTRESALELAGVDSDFVSRWKRRTRLRLPEPDVATGVIEDEQEPLSPPSKRPPTCESL
jgi:hypothetical protein